MKKSSEKESRDLEIQKRIKDFFNAEIKKRGITQKLFADTLGISSPDATNLLHTESKRVTVAHLVAAADYFNISTDEILGREKPAADKSAAPSLLDIASMIVEMDKMDLIDISESEKSGTLPEDTTSFVSDDLKEGTYHEHTLTFKLSESGSYAYHPYTNDEYYQEPSNLEQYALNRFLDDYMKLRQLKDSFPKDTFQFMTSVLLSRLYNTEELPFI